ncbi:MAG: DinB family protein [Desulfovibrionales bacterium]
MTFDLAAANAEAKRRIIPALEGEGAHISFEEAVADFPEALMNVKPDNVPYTFWHMLEHMRIAQWDILRYIQDPGHTSPTWPNGYWPDQDAEADRAAVNTTVKQFLADREQLVQLIEEPGCKVLEPVEHMSGNSILREALLVVDHTAYHLGEFVMGRQIMGYWKSGLEDGAG